MNQPSIKLSLHFSVKIILTFLMFGVTLNLHAQTLKPYQPTRQQELKAYKDAALLDSLARKSVFKSYVYANWQADEKGFWHKNLLPGDSVEYLYVDVATSAKKKAFDQTKHNHI